MVSSISTKPSVLRSYFENWTRYLMADIALGASMAYYEAYTDDPCSIQAIKRLKNGVVITNLHKLERIEDPKKGVLVVFRGTRRKIRGSDVRLSTDRMHHESVVRTMLADMALRGAQAVALYREKSVDANAAEAVARGRWGAAD
jgi:hypothetical protein